MASPSAPVRITNASPPPPTSATQFWTNVTDPFLVEECLELLAQSTSASQIDNNVQKAASLMTFLNNIAAQRTAVWLWVDVVAAQSMTVVFHGADGPTNARFNTCAGIDGVAPQLAATLWTTAIKTLAANNGNIGTDNFYMWTVTGTPLQTSDAISPVITQLGSSVGSAQPENPYGSQANAQMNPRWPVNQTTQKFSAQL